MDDPFVSNTGPTGVQPQQQRESHRYSSFGSQLFTLNASSPSQVKRALEAHLAETERRLEDASKLGTALVQQQKDLSDKLKEIELQQDEGEIGPELRRKLADLEKEYHDIGRETARASLGAKPRLVPTDEDAQGTPSFDGRVSTSSSFEPMDFLSSSFNIYNFLVRFDLIFEIFRFFFCDPYIAPCQPRRTL